MIRFLLKLAIFGAKRSPSFFVKLVPGLIRFSHV
jgi:hypothetical protein